MVLHTAAYCQEQTSRFQMQMKDPRIIFSPKKPLNKTLLQVENLFPKDNLKLGKPIQILMQSFFLASTAIK